VWSTAVNAGFSISATPRATKYLKGASFVLNGVVQFAGFLHREALSKRIFPFVLRCFQVKKLKK